MNRRTLLIGAGTLIAAGTGVAAWRGATGSMADYEAYSAQLRAALTPDIADVIRYATLAPNSHNTQPWRFRVTNDVIEVLPDFARRTPVVDPDDHHVFVSLGCAAANLAIAASASGRPGELVLTADGAGVHYTFTTNQPRTEPWLEAITKRQSTRAEYDGRAVSTADITRLQTAGAAPGVNLVIVTARAEMATIGELVVAGNSAQMADPAFMRELKQWVRFNPRSAMETGDGLFSSASGNPSLPTALGRIAFDRVVSAGSENDKYARQIASSAGLAVFVGDEADSMHWIKVGQACQRFALEATRLGLKLAFINQPVEIADLRPELARLIGTTKRPDLVLRFGYGPTLPYAPRRPVAEVLGS
ncbi:Acg family FMN-binding oxidoreductase [Bradyrhizobium sp. HKCCYLS1011]|uniref:Acg family FMN-binding oxidoreductase n=1 Tax=Bradyrhizobium sp. HKCCYLS1011 TaxID=3420733 RepID=UPI003EBACF3A